MELVEGESLVEDLMGGNLWEIREKIGGMLEKLMVV